MKEKVEEIMTKDVITVKEDDSVSAVAQVFKANKIAGTPVINDREEVVGVISEADILKVFGNFHWYSSVFMALDSLRLHEDEKTHEHDIQQDREKASGLKVKDVMSKNPKTVLPDALIDDATQIMHETGFNRLPVVDDAGKLIGIVTRADIIASLYEA